MKLQNLTHALAILAGVLSIVSVALTQPPFSVSPSIPAAMGVVVTVLVYISNQIPALGSTPATPVSAPQPPSTTQ